MSVDPRLARRDHVDLGCVTGQSGWEQQRGQVFGGVEGETLPDARQCVEVFRDVGGVGRGVGACLRPEARDHRPAGVVGD